MSNIIRERFKLHNWLRFLDKIGLGLDLDLIIFEEMSQNQSTEYAGPYMIDVWEGEARVLGKCEKKQVVIRVDS